MGRRAALAAPALALTGVRLTVLGGCGAWPEAGQACSGFLIEQDGFRLHDQPFLSSARAAGQHAAQAGVARLLLTHLWPGTGHGAARAAAATGYDGDIGVARAGLVTDV